MPAVPPHTPPSSSLWATTPVWKTSSFRSKHTTTDHVMPQEGATSSPEWRSSSILDSLQQVKGGGGNGGNGGSHKGPKGKRVAKGSRDKEVGKPKRSQRSAAKNATARGNRNQHGGASRRKKLSKERGGDKHYRADKGSGRGQQKQEGSATKKGRAQEAAKPAGQLGRSGRTKAKPQKPPLPDGKGRQGSKKSMHVGILPR